MRYKKLGNTDLNVSTVGLGTWALAGSVAGSDSWGVMDDRVSEDTIRHALERGINLIDTSPSYGIGHGEEVVGRAVMGQRHKAVIVTKCGTFKKDGKIYRDLRPEAIRGQLEGSLTRLGTEYTDLYLIHWPDPSTPLSDTLGELCRLKEEGKIRYIGVSNFSRELLDEARTMADIVCIQPQFSLLARESEGLIQYAHSLDMGVLTYGSLGAGILSGKYDKLPDFGGGDARNRFYKTFFSEPMFSRSMELVNVLRDIAGEHGRPVSQVAINWVAQQPWVTSAIVGAKNEGQIEENAMAGEWMLSENELEKIRSAYADIMEIN